jgi:SAM-dependent methyltransferase
MTIDERSIEIPWLLARLGRPKHILDVGAAHARYLEAMLSTGSKVIALDTHLFNAPPDVQVFVGNAAAMPDEWSDRFDLVTCISALDHIGLSAYGNPADPEALEKSAHEMWRVLRPGGQLLLTAPFGRDHVTSHPGGGQRVFGIDALRALFPANHWHWRGTWFWKLIGDEYILADELACAACEYDGLRAQSVVAMTLEKA